MDRLEVSQTLLTGPYMDLVAIHVYSVFRKLDFCTFQQLQQIYLNINTFRYNELPFKARG